MLEKLKEKRKIRRAKRAEPWSKKKKIIFLSVLVIAIAYIIISALISGDEISLPSLNISVNGFDIILICLLGIGLAVIKIRAYIKQRRKDGDKNK